MKSLEELSRSRIWQDLGIGPQWLERAPAVMPEDLSVAPIVTAGAHADLVRAADWQTLDAMVSACTRCGLCRTRTQTVFGVGSKEARIMVVGEAPGAEEDARGEPFVGQAGKLLDQMLLSVGMSRDQQQPERAVFVANALKCRPPGNRNPAPEEMAECETYLMRQFALLRPRVVIVMGRFAAQAVLKSSEPISALRGKVHALTVEGDSPAAAIVTYHPAYLLRNLADKAKAWADLCLAKDVLTKASVQR